MQNSQRITPHLWFVDNAEEAARFYASIFPDSRVDRVTPIPADTPSGPAGSVAVVEFTLFGQAFMAISAGPLDPLNHAISFVVNCANQAEVDRYWDALLDGGSPEQCGWLKDRYGRKPPWRCLTGSLTGPQPRVHMRRPSPPSIACPAPSPTFSESLISSRSRSTSSAATARRSAGSGSLEGR